MNKTPLYDIHCKLGGKLIDFGGWALPVQYSGIIEEHEQVRNAAGLFDVSHMGEITVKGRDAAEFIHGLVINKIIGAKEGQAIYSPMCYEDGGVVDDLLVYKFNEEHFLLVVNASNTDKDFSWIKQNLKGQVSVENVSERYAQLAIQGPKAEQILQKLTETSLADTKFFHFKNEVDIGGIKAIVSRTGYTGEDGFELYISSDNAEELWEKLLDAGKPEGLVPVGLGARDTLRFEAALPLYGHELSPDISPLEAGLGRFVKLEKEYFIGRDALLKQKNEGLKRKLVGFEMIDRGIPRNQHSVQYKGETIGFVTTGGHSPSLKKSIGLALVKDCMQPGEEFEIIVRNKPLKAKIIDIPFYTKKYRK